MAILNFVMRLFLAAMCWKPQTRPQSRVRISYKTVKMKLILSVIIPPFVMFLIANAQEFIHVVSLYSPNAFQTLY